ncbi:DUF3368 domain-containing protein [Candidatus Acetothermia bacterium]|nr:DUF3368 domain-containing protein [Candidatus Acetothermia bacterium]
MRPIIADSSPLIGLSRINQLELLPKLFGSVLVPPVVVEELFSKGHEKKGVEALRAATWLKTQELKDPNTLKVISSTLDPGERAAIALAYESKEALLVDDLAARREAERLGIEIYGTLSVLLEAKVDGFIPALKPLVEALVQEGFWLSPKLIEDILREANESKKNPRT